MTITNDIQKLETLYNQLNKEFYNGELEEVTITYKDNIKAYGYITVNKVWSKIDEAEGKRYEINISSNSINRGYEKVCATLLHEMAHLYNLEHDIKDCSNNNKFHNKKFKATAEAHGLEISKDDRYGWTITEIAEWAKPVIEKFHVEFETLRHVQEKGPSKKAKSYKHVCPICGAIARTTKDTIHLICGDCNVEMEIEE